MNPNHTEINARAAVNNPSSVFHHYRAPIELPDGPAWSGAELVLGNPTAAPDRADGDPRFALPPRLKPWEARVYRTSGQP